MKTKKKAPTLTDLKKKADALFSKFIRNKYADAEGMISCYTCPYRSEIKKIQCGHFVSRQYIDTRYDERNARPQCWYCNSKMFGNGRSVEFGWNLEQEYGKGIVDELFAKAKPLTKNFDYQAIIDKYSI